MINQVELFGDKENANQMEVYFNKVLEREIKSLEKRYHFSDEQEYFRSLVNFSRSKLEPYQRWAKYREGYSEELVKELIRRSDLNKDKHFIIDPMSGSGTTLVTANQMGFDALGIDVNPYSVFLANCKVDKYSEKEIEGAKRILNDFELKDWNSSKTKSEDLNGCRKYFDEENYSYLLEIKDEIDKIDGIKIKNLFHLAWLIVLEDCSNRKKDGNGLATRKSKVTNVFEFFAGKLRLMLNDFLNHPIPQHTCALTVQDTAQNLFEIADSFSKRVNKKPAAIIFSPPYINSFDYFESYKIELLFGGFCDFENLSKLREKAIRNYRKAIKEDLNYFHPVLEKISNEIWKAIPKKEKRTGKRDGRTRLMAKVITAYFKDMDGVIQNISETLIEGGKCYIVVDQSAYVGIIVPTDLLLASIAEKHGLNVAQIIKCRKAITSGQQLKQFPYLKDNLRESIVVLEKPSS